MARVVLKTTYGTYKVGDVLTDNDAVAFLDTMPAENLYVRIADEQPQVSAPKEAE